MGLYGKCPSCSTDSERKSLILGARCAHFLAGGKIRPTAVWKREGKVVSRRCREQGVQLGLKRTGHWCLLVCNPEQRRKRGRRRGKWSHTNDQTERCTPLLMTFTPSNGIVNNVSRCRSQIWPFKRGAGWGRKVQSRTETRRQQEMESLSLAGGLVVG